MNQPKKEISTPPLLEPISENILNPKPMHVYQLD
ncbi:Uncharacterised protein [Legionella maceachernii]|nr:Uncharacterised protein [Legionella maceachernii]